MVKLSLMLSMLGIVYSCSEAKAEGATGALIGKPLDSPKVVPLEDYKVLPSADEVKKFFYEQIKSLSIFAVPNDYSQQAFQSSHFLTAWVTVNQKEPASKYRVSKLLEMGMTLPINPKMSWGAEVSISKYKNNFETETKPKRPATGFRLKPDIYTFQIGLKYKI